MNKLEKKKNQLSLIKIIDNLESKRLQTAKKIAEYKVGSKVSHQGRVGIIKEVSPKNTSILVEFNGKSERFFFRRRADNLTVETLSMHKIIETVQEGGPGSGVKGHTTSDADDVLKKAGKT